MPATWEGVAGVDRVQAPTMDQAGRLVGFSFESAIGGSNYLGNATLNARDEGRLIGWDIENAEIRGSITVTLDEASPGTLLSVDLELSSKGMLSTMFFPIIARTIGNGLPKTVDAFAAQFSSDTSEEE